MDIELKKKKKLVLARRAVPEGVDKYGSLQSDVWDI